MFNLLYYLICDNLVQSVSSVGNIVFVIVIVFVFFLSHADCAEYAELPFIWLLVHAGAGIRRLCRRLCHDCHAECSSNHSTLIRSTLTGYLFSFQFSHFSVPTAPAVVTKSTTNSVDSNPSLHLFVTFSLYYYILCILWTEGRRPKELKSILCEIIKSVIILSNQCHLWAILSTSSLSFYPPLPSAGTRPCLRGRKWVIAHWGCSRTLHAASLLASSSPLTVALPH